MLQLWWSNAACVYFCLATLLTRGWCAMFVVFISCIHLTKHLRIKAALYVVQSGPHFQSDSSWLLFLLPPGDCMNEKSHFSSFWWFCWPRKLISVHFQMNHLTAYILYSAKFSFIFLHFDLHFHVTSLKLFNTSSVLKFPKIENSNSCMIDELQPVVVIAFMITVTLDVITQ